MMTYFKVCQIWKFFVLRFFGFAFSATKAETATATTTPKTETTEKATGKEKALKPFR